MYIHEGNKRLVNDRDLKYFRTILYVWIILGLRNLKIPLHCVCFVFSFSGRCEVCAYDEEIHSTTRTEESSSSEATAEFFSI